MRLKASIMIPLSIVLGIGAVQSGRGWIDRQVNQRVKAMQTKPAAKTVEFATIVVAAQPLRFGTQIKPGLLKEIPWPQGQMPKGAFAKVQDIFKDNGNRSALDAIEVNEPILASKLTGPGQKANLAGLLETGMKAITVRVDDVVGVAGFVLPGDRVDVLLTRKLKDESAIADRLLQNIKVLAIDQKADDRLDKPSVARAVTLEVTTDQAQRLIVGQKVGSLTMVLRPVGETQREAARSVSSRNLSNEGEPAPAPVIQQAQKLLAPRPSGPRSYTVNVIRRSERKQYKVPAYGR